jgi:hypothetical protein
MAEPEPKLLRFDLRDLLLVVFLIAVGLLIAFSYLFGRGIPASALFAVYGSGFVIGTAVAVIVVTLLAALAALARCNEKRSAGVRRGLWIVAYTAFAWILLGAMYPHREIMASHQTAAAAACKAYAEAQELYRRTDYDGDGVLEYALTISGKFGLREAEVKAARKTEYVDEAFALAEGEPGTAQARFGYCFKVLTAQGPDATGGARSYVTAHPGGESMTLGYALVAYPAYYDVTGRDTFIINNNGTIFQMDFGMDTHAIVSKMTAFNPLVEWFPVE